MRLIVASLAALVLVSPATADNPHSHSEPGQLPRPDGHAPLGVMGDHTHAAGGWMFTYRYARMRMDGNRDGDDPRSVSDVFANFAVAPKDMDMEMHMFGLMYAPTDWLTLMAMLPWVELSMDHVVGMNGLRFTTKSDGPGDLRLSGLFRLFENDMHHVHAHAGVSFPTGTVRERDGLPTPMGLMEMRLPYPMQIGSGTFDLLPGLTYTGQTRWLSWGAQALGTIRLDENKNDYRLGNRVDTTLWVAHPWTKWFSTSARVAYHWWGNIDGRDDALNPAAVPTADPNRRAGQRVDLLGGVNFVVPLGPLGDHRIAAEAGFPIHQDLDGPQLETDWRVWVGWQYAF
jgi:hypothetical protein